MVGGAVRDELLQRPVQDRDYVVVGATADEMIRLGFRPVGRDFPVFLHPQTQEEYALARTERKTAPGYRGFQVFASPEVTLEEDLARRDLTINAIARDAQGQIIDPYGGVQDLQKGILRHVSPAFVEDPVRILRLARFAARFGFQVAPETMALMREMVAGGEVDALVPERVWSEISRGLMENHPSRMFDILRECGALADVLPALEVLVQVPLTAAGGNAYTRTMQVVEYAARVQMPLPVRFAVLTHLVGQVQAAEPASERIQQFCQLLRAPNDCREVAQLTAAYHEEAALALDLTAGELLALLVRLDALRQGRRFEWFLDAAQCIACAARPDRPFPQQAHLMDALQAAQAIDAGAVARASSSPAEIRANIEQARLAAIADWLDNRPASTPS